MDTKLKKSKLDFLYKKSVKAFSVILLYITAFVTFSGFIYIYMNMNRWYIMPVGDNSYFETPVFSETVSEALNYIVDVEVLYQSEENIKNGNAVNKTEILNDFKSYYHVVDGVITGSTVLNEAGNDLIVIKEIPEYLKTNFEEYRDLIQKKLPQYTSIYIGKQLDDYKFKKRIIDSYKNINYYILDLNDNVVSTNSNRDYIDNCEIKVIVDGPYINDTLNDYSSNLLKQNSESALSDKGYKIVLGVNENLVPGDVIFDEFKDFEFTKDIMISVFITLGISLFFSIILLLYLYIVTGKKYRNDTNIVRWGVDIIYNDMQTVFMIFSTIISSLIGYFIISDIIYMSSVNFYFYLGITILGIICACFFTMFLFYSTSMVRQIKAGTIFKNTLIGALLRSIAGLFNGKTFRGWMSVLLIGFAVVNGLFGVVFGTIINLYYGQNEVLFIFICLVIIFNAFCVYLLSRSLKSLTKIMNAAHETGEGNLDYKLDINEISPSLKNFATDVRNVQYGLTKAVEKAVRGERMKTELITNVSHDLKTPLTSIITYADLLKNQELNNPDADRYANILYEKSYRLKQLIEDLIEASKVSSGNISVEYSKINMRQLVIQALGEFEERIENSGLDVKINVVEDVNIKADGKHMWRIFENLITNAIKYSMKNTRLYIDICKDNNKGLFIIKNITENPIDISVEHLSERFVRGDESRTTEGSGLGLSITKSLAELQAGSLKIEVDGDLFKATIEMQLWEEE